MVTIAQHFAAIVTTTLATITVAQLDKRFATRAGKVQIVRLPNVDKIVTRCTDFAKHLINAHVGQDGRAHDAINAYPTLVVRMDIVFLHGSVYAIKTGVAFCVTEILTIVELTNLVSIMPHAKMWRPIVTSAIACQDILVSRTKNLI